MIGSGSGGADPPASSQRQLAHDLVGCLGREGAIHVCKVNCWRGILEVILAEEAPPPPRHRSLV